MRFCSRSRLRANRVLRALRDVADVPRRQLENTDRKAAIALMRANTPVRRPVSRHTRELLRSYCKAGRLTTPIAAAITRKVVAHADEELALLYSYANDEERFLVDFFIGTMARDMEACRCRYRDLTGTTPTPVRQAAQDPHGGVRNCSHWCPVGIQVASIVVEIPAFREDNSAQTDRLGPHG
jgi:hypothetical protein